MSSETSSSEDATTTTTCTPCSTPRLKTHALGSCAVVSLSDTQLRRKPLGHEIDSHDTVVRLGYAPTKGYEKYVGRRVDVTLIRMHTRKRDCKLAHDVWREQGGKVVPKKFYVLLSGERKGIKTRSLATASGSHSCTPASMPTYKNRPVLYLEDPPEQLLDVRDSLFDNLAAEYAFREDRSSSNDTATNDAYNPKGGFKPTSGYYTIYSLLGSRLCKSITLYGFYDDYQALHYFAWQRSDDGSSWVPRVHNTTAEKGRNAKRAPVPSHPLKPNHVNGAESWVYRALMATGNVCVRTAPIETSKDDDDSDDGTASPNPKNDPTKVDHLKPIGTSCKIQPNHLDYTANKIANATMKNDPYQHVYISEIFHKDVYRCMMDHLPTNNKAYGRLKAGVERYMITLLSNKRSMPGKTSSSGKFVPLLSRDKDRHGFDADFWGAFAKAFGSERFRDLWLNLFDNTLSLRKADWRSFAGSNLGFKMELNRDRGGFEIGPHTDSHGKWVTALYYLPRQERVGGGTCVVRSRSGRVQHGDSSWETWNDPDFEIVDRAAFHPNSVFAFAPCQSSWHAVERMSSSAAYRDTIQSFVMTLGGDKVRKAKCAN